MSEVTEDPPTTPYELREAVRCELADFVSVEGVGQPLDDDAAGYDLVITTRTARIVRDLAQALESLDRVVWQNTPTGAQVTPPVNVEALAVQLWNATQDAGASTAVGDAVVAELRKAFGDE